MARYELTKGLPVITVAEGRQIGKVDDLVVDPERKAVSWFRLHSGGMLGGERRQLHTGWRLLERRGHALPSLPATGGALVLSDANHSSGVAGNATRPV